MRCNIARIYIAERSVEDYNIYLVMDQKIDMIGIYSYNSEHDEWKGTPAREILPDSKTDGEVEQELTRSIWRNVPTIADTAANRGPEEIEIWDPRGDSTIWAVTMELRRNEEYDDHGPDGIKVYGAYGRQYGGAIHNVLIPEHVTADGIKKYMRTFQASSWAAKYIMTAIRHFGEILDNQLLFRCNTWRQDMEEERKRLREM